MFFWRCDICTECLQNFILRVCRYYLSFEYDSCIIHIILSLFSVGLTPILKLQRWQQRIWLRKNLSRLRQYTYLYPYQENVSLCMIQAVVIPPHTNTYPTTFDKEEIRHRFDRTRKHYPYNKPAIMCC